MKEVTLDLTPTLERIARRAFFPMPNWSPIAFTLPAAGRGAVKKLRIEYRWEAIEQENK
ncbi:hypothetical protein FM107_01025 [Sphingobacterium sp. JB170]|nr:hypothetical protein FM107_01025 [Sphingobacterium sp. JB170]